MWERTGECGPGWLDAPLPPVMLSSNGPSWGRTGFDEGNEPFGACRGSLFLFKKRATQQTPTTTLSSRWPPKRLKHAGPRSPADGAGKSRHKSRLVFRGDRKSTRLNSSHDQISYAVFCLKKK